MMFHLPSGLLPPTVSGICTLQTPSAPTVQPVITRPPEMTGRCPMYACHVTGASAVPLSAGVNSHAFPNAYMPSIRWTVMGCRPRSA